MNASASRRILLLLLICFIISASAYPNFNRQIPNGERVKYDGESWPGVGHNKVYGGGDLNAFGRDFMRAGNKWTMELCKHDSDGDGRSNGEELGDPECKWRIGHPNPKVRFVTHPGVADECPSPAPAPSVMKIGIIGSGNVGQALHKAFTNAGLTVVFGVRNLETHTGGGNVMLTKDAAQWATVIFLAVPGTEVVNVAKEIAGFVKGKTVIDCTNPITWDKGPVWSPPESGSLTAELDNIIPDAWLVKAFNTFGVEHMEDPTLSGMTTQVLMAGDNALAKKTVSQICERAKFLPVDAGPLRNAASLENLAVLWVHLATIGGKGREFIFTTFPQ